MTFKVVCGFVLRVLILLMCQNRELGEKTNDDEIRAMINEFDRDGDGESNRNVFFSKWSF